MKKYMLSILIISATFNMLCQDMEPNFSLARKNTYTELTGKYHSNVVNPYWLNNESFIYITDNKLFILVCNKKDKLEVNTELTDTGPYQYRFRYNGKNYLYNDYSNTISLDNPDDNTSSPNSAGSSLAYVVSDNLFLKSENSGKSKQLSHDGDTYYSFRANIDYNYTNQHFYDDTIARPANVTWSPDSSYFVAFRTDARNLRDNWVINSIASPRPQLSTYKQRNPGDDYPIDELWIYKPDENSFINANLKKWENESYWFIGWSLYTNGFFIQRINREQTKCDILLVDKHGKYKLLIEEQPDANIYFPTEFRELGNNSYLWRSRCDGYSHLYYINTDKKIVNQLTRGDFTFEKIAGLDSISNKLYFTAFGKETDVNPYYRFLYSLDLETNDIKLLTPEDANHNISLSPDYRFFVDNYSRVDLPHRSKLRNMNGELIMEVEEGDVEELVHSGWKDPEIFTVKAADSTTDIWGVMWKPFDFDPDKQYPVISYVYPGPQDNFVPLDYFQSLNNVHLSQYGFIVVMCGTRGSSYKRSKTFSEYYRTNLRDYPLADNKFMLEQLIEKHSFIDKDKIGIWGGSSGGFMAVSSILQYPDFYKVCVARSGQHDPNIFHAWWTDIFNTPVNQSKADTIYSNVSMADNLEGRLFIIHGETDMNVHPSNSARLVNELMKSGKHFDYLVVPGGGHGWSDNGLYVQKRIWLYFIENLMNYKIEDINIMDY